MAAFVRCKHLSFRWISPLYRPIVPMCHIRDEGLNSVPVCQTLPLAIVGKVQAQLITLIRALCHLVVQISHPVSLQAHVYKSFWQVNTSEEERVSCAKNVSVLKNTCQCSQRLPAFMWNPQLMQICLVILIKVGMLSLLWSSRMTTI